MADIDYNSAKEYLSHEHYYGRQIRSLFIASAVVMLITLPIFDTLIPFSGLFSMGMIILVVLLAGLLNPFARFVVVLCTVVSIVGGFIFEYEAVSAFWRISRAFEFWFFAVNELLAVLFFFALYYCSKTLRGVIFTSKTVH